MDAKLAEIYGTNQVDEADVEKLAAAELASGLAEENEIDVDGLSDDDAEALAAEVLAGSDEEGEVSEGDVSEEAQEKIAEADYLGRVMAHAYTAERMEIEKTAGKGGHVSKMVKHLQSEMKSNPINRMDKLRAGAKKWAGKAKDVATGKQAREGYKDLKMVGKRKGQDELKGAIKRDIGRGAAKTVGLYGGAAAAGYGAKKKMEKKSAAEEENLSALDTLALARAREILEANGIDVDQEQEKTSSLNEEQAALLSAKVDERALAMLQHAGYEFKESEESDE